MKKRALIISTVLFTAVLLFGATAAYAVDADSDTASTSPQTTISPEPQRVYNTGPLTGETKPKPTTTTEPQAIAADGGSDEEYSPSYVERQKSEETIKSNARGETRSSQDLPTTTTEKKKRPVAAVGEINTTTTEINRNKNGSVVVKGKKVDNPALAKSAGKRKPFDLGIDIKPYLAMAILLALSIMTGYKKKTLIPLGTRGTVMRKGIVYYEK